MYVRDALFALLVGGTCALVRSPRSNLPLPIIAPILAILITKLVFGDWDKGYQWSFMDIWFTLVIGGAGYIGATLLQVLQ